MAPVLYLWPRFSFGSTSYDTNASRSRNVVRSDGICLGSWQFTYIGVAVIAGILIDKWGVRRSLFYGTVLISLSAGLRYFTTGFGTLLLIVALFGIGGPLISIGAPKTVSVYFRGGDRGLAMGVYATGALTGCILALSATNKLVMPLVGFSWRLTFLLYGILALGTALLWRSLV